MKHKKTVSDAVRTANRANAQLSTGPRTDRGKSTASNNALRHGILARKIKLDTHEERKAYRQIWTCWKRHFHPRGQLEKFLVEEIANISWKLGITEALEVDELLRREYVRDDVGGVFHGDLKLPIHDWDLPLERGWDCERVIVRAVAGDDDSNSHGSSGPAVVQGQLLNGVQASQGKCHRHGGHLEVQAVLGSSLSNMTRYRSALKKDFYRAVERLCALKAERREQERQEAQRDSRPVTRED